MAALLKPGWSKPSTILFASEIPADQKAFAFALAQAQEFGSELIIFHAYDPQAVPASETSSIGSYDGAAAARPETLQLATQHLEPLAQQAREASVHCEVVLRPGLPADEILAYTRQREPQREIDRIVMGTHSQGPTGKLLVGSVTEAVLRTATSPVYIVGPGVPGLGVPGAVDGSHRNFATRTTLCAVNLQEASTVVAAFAAELAAQHGARLILQHVIRPQERAEFLASRSLDELEAGLLAMVPARLQGQVAVQTIVVPGDPTEELLYQSLTQHVDLIVLGAHGASAFAAVTRHGVVYKTLAHTNCPVITLSPVVLAQCCSKSEKLQSSEKRQHAEAYMAGVF
jgi:nucleotide-binding universal stress UspA family protein